MRHFFTFKIRRTNQKSGFVQLLPINSISVVTPCINWCKIIVKYVYTHTAFSGNSCKSKVSKFVFLWNPKTTNQTFKGTTIWSWGGGGGGGWQIWSGQIVYFHHGLGRKIYFRVNRGQNIYFQPQQIFEKAKKKKKKKGRTWLSMFCITFCRLLARNIAYLVAGIFW